MNFRRANPCIFCSLILFCAACLAAPQSTLAATIEMVTVGNPSNAPDTRYNGFSVGSVDHVLQIGKYEVTAGQYTEFLNAVADADPHGLYNPAMGSITAFPGANIQQAGSSPNFSYTVAADWANRPVNFVSFWDTARFANWLHNNQPTGPQGPGTTEDGAYHDVDNQSSFGRNAGAKFFIPNENEWYKAAYHDKTAGLVATYFDNATGTNSVPGNDINETTNPGNNVNYFTSGFAIGGPYYHTIAGEFQLSDSPYGTFDQAGNLYEWDETANQGFRFRRGGAFDNAVVTEIQASTYGLLDPATENYSLGFRVASPANIPEPASIMLCLAGVLMLALRRGRK